MKCLAEQPRLTIDALTGGLELNIRLSGNKKLISSEIADLQDMTLDIEIKKHREKRSLDANGYCWSLIDRLAEKLNLSPVEVYRAAIREIGGNKEIVCILTKSVDKMREIWRAKGKGWMVETEPSKLENCTNVWLYYGSSVYDTKQMSQLIDRIVYDCKDHCIETLPPDRLSAMLEEWDEKQKNKRD